MHIHYTYLYIHIYRCKKCKEMSEDDGFGPGHVILKQRSEGSTRRALQRADGEGARKILTKGSSSPYGYGSIPIHTIFRGMNIHLPAILMFTRGIGFWHTAISGWIKLGQNGMVSYQGSRFVGQKGLGSTWPILRILDAFHGFFGGLHRETCQCFRGHNR